MKKPIEVIIVNKQTKEEAAEKKQNKKHNNYLLWLALGTFILALFTFIGLDLPKKISKSDINQDSTLK